MNCPICEGTLELQNVNICACDTLPPVVVRGVPAMVCVRCGEKVLSQASIDALALVRKGLVSRPTTIRTYDLYDFSALQPTQSTKSPETSVVYSSAGMGRQEQGTLAQSEAVPSAFLVLSN